MAAALLGGATVYGVVAGLTAGDVPTVRGGAWTPATVRALLRAPGVAGDRPAACQLNGGVE